jgi:TRAP-type mannitol/chloroaromatic compound transport system permease small subunit
MEEFLINLRKLNISDMIMFRIEGRKSSPEVVIDRVNNRIEIQGSSTFKNTSWFYSNLLKWAIAFNQFENSATMINIRLNRINEHSAKWIMLIIRKLVFLLPEHKFVVNWFYQPANSSMQINGERIKLNSLVPVNLIAA